MGVLGGILGVVTGSVFVHYINEIQDLLAQLNPQLQVWTPDVYTFDRIPNVVKTHVAVAVFFAAGGDFDDRGAGARPSRRHRSGRCRALRYE